MLPGMIRHDIITKMSVLVGNPCVCQLCIGWRYHQLYQDLPPSVNMAGPARFGNQK